MQWHLGRPWFLFSLFSGIESVKPYKYNVHGRITVIKPSTKSMTPISPKFQFWLAWWSICQWTKWINPETHRWQMCHSQLWDLGNGGCFHSGLRVWLICPSAALHSYCYVFLNHCKYRYSIYIYMYCRYIFICSYIRSLHTLKSWPLEGWKLLFWHEILARRFVRERETESLLYLRAFKSYAEVHPQWLTIRDHRFGTMCCIRIIFPYESWICLAISIFFLEFHSVASKKPFNLASSGANVIGHTPSKPPGRWNSWLTKRWSCLSAHPCTQHISAHVLLYCSIFIDVVLSEYLSSYIVVPVVYLPYSVLQFSPLGAVSPSCCLVWHNARAHEIALLCALIIVYHLKDQIVAFLPTPRCYRWKSTKKSCMCFLLLAVRSASLNCPDRSNMKYSEMYNIVYL